LLLHKAAAIRPDDTAGSLYYDTLFPLGVQTVLDAVELIAAGNPPREPQDDSKATHDGLCRDDCAAIDWSRPVDQVYNLIRGCDPQPGAFTQFRGEKLRLYDCRKVEMPSAAPGVVADVADGLVIGAKGGGICAKRVRFGTAKTSASDFIKAQGIETGTRLG
jgi:methionyl-tRNA formyltransferase